MVSRSADDLCETEGATVGKQQAVREFAPRRKRWTVVERATTIHRKTATEVWPYSTHQARGLIQGALLMTASIGCRGADSSRSQRGVPRSKKIHVRTLSSQG